MIIVSIISLIFSLLFQGIISNYLGYTYDSLSFFSTVYVLLNLLVLRPFFENEKKYLYLVVIFGFIVDIAYTNTFVLNACLFVLIYYFTKFFHSFFPYNFIMINISSLIGVFLYHILSFFILFILKYDSYSFLVLFKVLTHSIIMSIIYTSFIYYVLNFFKNKFDLKEVK